MARRTSVHFTTGLLVTCGLAAAVACGSSSSSEFGDGSKDSGIGTLPGQGNDGGDGGNISIIGTGGDGGTLQFASLAFDPPAATVVVTGNGAIPTSFTLMASLTAGGTEPITPQSLAFDRPDLGTAANGDPVVVTAPSPLGLYGGTGTLHAIYGGVEATATLTVVVHQVDYGTGVSAGSPAVTAFNGGSADGGAGAGDGGGSGGMSTVGDGGVVELPTDPNSTISPLLYPYDATVFPLGITTPPVMFNAPQAGDVYWLHYVEKNYVFDGYYALPALPGSIRLPQDAWDRITASNGAATAPDPLAFTLSRWDNKTGKAYRSATATWTIAPASLQGAIYYWTTPNSNDSSGPAAVTRIPPGAGAMPVPITPPSGTNCTGCHAVSADGTTLVAGVSGESAVDGNGDNRAWTSFDLPSGTVRKVSNRFSGNLAVSPDGKYVVSGIDALDLCDSTTGAVIANTNLETTPLDPNMTGLKDQAFAPSGKTLAAVEAGGDWQYWNFSITPVSELVTLSFDPVAVAFGTKPTKLLDSTSSKLPAGQTVIAYPSFSPDSSAIAFQAADHNSGCWGGGGDCATTTTESGSIFLISATGGDPVRLTNLTDPPAMADRNLALEPTFNPTARGGYQWLVFTSERNWGNEPDVQGTADNDKKRLWVSAVDPVLGTTDPSHPAFFLEGQGTTTTNMRGFWTQAACIATPGESGSSGTTADAGGPDAAASDAGGAASDGGSSGACVNGFDCCSGFCNAGQCIGVSQVSCAGVGGSCKSAGDCCNSGSVSCINGSCTVGSIR